MTTHEEQGREALALLQLVRRYKEWAAHRGDDEAVSQWRAVEGALKAHDAEVAAAARLAEQVRMRAWLENHAEELVREATDRIALADEGNPR